MDLIVTNDVPVFVDDPRPRMAQHNGKIALQRRDTLSNEIRRELIVVCRPLEILSGRQLKHPVEVPRGSDVTLISQVTDTRVACCSGLTKRLRLIRRSVVGDDQFQVTERLTQNRI